MATLIFVILVSSFFLAAAIAFTKAHTTKELIGNAAAAGYVIGGLVMGSIYELYKIIVLP
jgi:hypothetical protein